jgi:hypothetical protein
LNYNQIITESTLLVDFGLVILIWMVQLIIYPSFVYYTKEDLFTWHQKYTNRIAIIVVPLMLTQLVLAFFAVFYQANFTTIFTLLIVFFLWIFTFLGFAPLHFKISEGKHNHKLLQLLIQRNWIRTFLWSILFIFHLLMYIFY